MLACEGISYTTHPAAPSQPAAAAACVHRILSALVISIPLAGASAAPRRAVGEANSVAAFECTPASADLQVRKAGARAKALPRVEYKSRKNVEKSKIPEGRESPEALRGMGGEQDPLKPGTVPERNGQKRSKFG